MKQAFNINSVKSSGVVYAGDLSTNEVVLSRHPRLIKAFDRYSSLFSVLNYELCYDSSPDGHYHGCYASRIDLSDAGVRRRLLTDFLSGLQCGVEIRNCGAHQDLLFYNNSECPANKGISDGRDSGKSVQSSANMSEFQSMPVGSPHKVLLNVRKCIIERDYSVRVQGDPGFLAPRRGIRGSNGEKRPVKLSSTLRRAVRGNINNMLKFRPDLLYAFVTYSAPNHKDSSVTPEGREFEERLWRARTRLYDALGHGNRLVMYCGVSERQPGKRKRSLSGVPRLAPHYHVIEAYSMKQDKKAYEYYIKLGLYQYLYQLDKEGFEILSDLGKRRVAEGNKNALYALKLLRGSRYKELINGYCHFDMTDERLLQAGEFQYDALKKWVFKSYFAQPYDITFIEDMSQAAGKVSHYMTNYFKDIHSKSFTDKVMDVLPKRNDSSDLFSTLNKVGESLNMLSDKAFLSNSYNRDYVK
jgi:hypothetical protein